jgi:hypothetical protein
MTSERWQQIGELFAVAVAVRTDLVGSESKVGLRSAKERAFAKRRPT